VSGQPGGKGAEGQERRFYHEYIRMDICMPLLGGDYRAPHILHKEVIEE